MGFSLVTSYPVWFLILCILAGVLASALLYYKNKKNEFSPFILKVLAILRGVLVALIAFLLLSPFVRTINRHKEKPIILLAVDNSASIAIGKDSAYYKREFVQEIIQFSKSLEGKFEIQPITFGEKVSFGNKEFNFKEKLSNMSSLFSEIKDRFSNRNVAALVIASDGIYNDGTDPLYASDDAPFTIYSVALGDTSQNKDVYINRVNYNQIAFLGNDFPIEINLAAYKCAGNSVKLSITSGNQSLFSENTQVLTDDFSKTFSARLSAGKTGIQRYRIAVSTISGEVSTLNNVQDIFVEVLDSKQKVLLLHSAPHPDIAALKQAIEGNKNYSVETSLLKEFNGSLNQYNLVVLHQIPSLSDVGFAVTNQIKNLSVPVLYILGSQSNIAAYNSLMAGLLITVGSQSFNEATAAVAPDFNYFALTPEIQRMVTEFPPLSVPFGQYKTGTAASALFYQKVGNIATKMPLIVFNQGVDRKSATIVGEGIWRWRLVDYAKNGNQLAFNDLFSRVVQYLSVKEDKSKFRIIMNNHFYENESIHIDAELYNDSYMLVNEPEVTIQITNSEKKNFPFTFSRSSQSYFLDAGSLPAGDYSYKASTNFGGKKLEKSGMFTVIALNAEWTNMVADHGLLNNMVVRHNGEMVYPKQLNELIEKIRTREDFKTISYSQKKFTELVSFFPLLILLILLLGVEWFVRKRSGSY